MATDWAEKRRHAEYQAQLRAEHAAVDRAHREAAAARTEIGRIGDQTARDIRKLLNAEQAAADATETEFRRAVIATEREAFGRARTVRRGGTRGVEGSIHIWHWRTDGAGLGVEYTAAPAGYGGCVWLPAGGGFDRARHAMGPSSYLVADSPQHRAWIADTVAPAVAETINRYGSLLTKLRDDAWFAALCERVGIAMTEQREDTHQGSYEVIRQKVTVVDVPSLLHGRVDPDGLVLVYRHRVGDTAARWSKSLDALRAALKAVGAPADNLRVAEDGDGNIEVRFHDADPFDGVAGLESRFDADRGRSLLGVTSTGREAWITWNGSSGMVVGGVPGSGKTASMLPVFAAMAGQAELHVFDGKSGFDLEPLKPIARTYNRSGDIDSPLETLRRIEELRTTRAEALHRAAKANNFWNMRPADRTRLGVTPVFVVLDEVQTWTDLSGMDKDEKATAAEIGKLIRTLIQKGRSAGIVCVLTTQKPDAGTIPTVIRDNAALKLCFRVSTPEQATTVLGGQAAGAPDPCAIPMRAKGRCVMETEGQGTVLVQAGYADPDVIADRLAEAEPVPDQLTVARRLLGLDEPAPASEVVTSSNAAADADADAAYRARIAAEAARLGLIPASADTDTDTGADTVETTPSAPPARRRPAAGTITGDL